MDKRPLVAILLVCLSFTLLAPPVAGGADAADEVVSLSTGDIGFDGPTLDRLRLAAPTGSLGRIDTDGVLEQSTRAAAFSAIERTPGKSLEAIAATVGVTKSTVRYHVEVLCDAGRAVARHEPASVTAVAEATDRAPSTVSHHLSALEERGYVERERAGEAVMTTLSPATWRALADDPTPADD
ncbi:hypothetical protein BRC84_06270 [Halobacteriales archaeon QS_1_68_44]|nr:MAG: hypothetical protein BRC84_06270 [Halobacteriales archaeon QS_1_68_44]